MCGVVSDIYLSILCWLFCRFHILIHPSIHPWTCLSTSPCVIYLKSIHDLCIYVSTHSCKSINILIVIFENPSIACATFCICTHRHIYIYIDIQLHRHIEVDLEIVGYIGLKIFTSIHICTYILFTYIHLYIYTSIHTYICIHTYIHRYIHTYIHTYVYT